MVRARSCEPQLGVSLLFGLWSSNFYSRSFLAELQGLRWSCPTNQLCPKASGGSVVPSHRTVGPGRPLCAPLSGRNTWGSVFNYWTSTDDTLRSAAHHVAFSVPRYSNWAKYNALRSALAKMGPLRLLRQFRGGRTPGRSPSWAPVLSNHVRGPRIRYLDSRRKCERCRTWTARLVPATVGRSPPGRGFQQGEGPLASPRNSKFSLRCERR
ncbi:hypothetical protein NDU88_002208 [Pleurodeles waltl]|uniref:Uncharacterized protein n=1 Tax=Pleurodeles waltl TaxID=8319 RepID=A0AAV7LZW8_PLEWA|nr:hypothetical protein NDU88_002208 [Pleurodeles waltl]